MKRYLKMSIILLVLLSISLLLNTKVQANEITVTEEQATQMLNLVPDSIEIDLKEIDNVDSEAENLVREKINEIWAENGFNKEEINELEEQYKITVFNVGIIGGYQYSSINDFYEANISIYYNNFDNFINKKVNIIYSNHKDYNVEDENYVKSLKIEKKKYFEIPLGENLNHFVNEDSWIQNLIDKYYEDLLNDKSITIKSSTGCGDGTLLNNSIGEEELQNAILIFKNGVLYDRRVIGMQITIPVITIPYYLQSEEEIQNYALNLIKNTYSEGYDLTNLSITKGINVGEWESLWGIGNDIKDGYTVTGEGNFYHSWVILRKEETIKSVEENTKIQFEASKDVVPENTTLEVKEVNDEETLNQIRVSLQDTSTKYVAYDITLKSDNVTVKPNGKVQISIPIPKDFDKNNLVVYRIEPNGDKIAYEVKLKSIDGQDYAVFETDHFSNYVLAERNAQQNSNEHILDDEPKTGTNNYIIFISLLSTFAIVSIVIARKRK